MECYELISCQSVSCTTWTIIKGKILILKHNLEQSNDFRIEGRGSYVLQKQMTDPLAQSFQVLLGESVTEKVSFSVDELDQIS